MRGLVLLMRHLLYKPLHCSLRRTVLWELISGLRGGVSGEPRPLTRSKHLGTCGSHTLCVTNVNQVIRLKSAIYSFRSAP